MSAIYCGITRRLIGRIFKGTKSITVEEFLAIYSEAFKIPEKQLGTYEDFMEGLKLYDKESNGLCSLAELSQVLVAMGKMSFSGRHLVIRI